MSKARKPGRPRSESAHRAILEATSRLLETTVIRDVTIEGIAREAGVGKPTIYRWWDGKCSLVMEAFLTSAQSRVPFPENAGSTAQALSFHILRVVEFLRGESGRMVAEMVGEGQADPKVLEKFRKLFFSRLLDPARMAIEGGKAGGELDAELDTDLALDLVYGPIYYRLLVGHGALDDHFAKGLAARIACILGA